MSMVSIDMIPNAPASGDGTCEDFGLCGLGDGPVAQDTGGKWKWKGGKAGQRDIYGREYGSPVYAAPAPASPYYPPTVAPPFYGSPINWASAWPFYANQTPQSAFSPLWRPPYTPSNTDVIVPTTGPAASSYFMSQFVASPPGTPAFQLDFSASPDDFDTGMEGLDGPAEDLEMQAAMLEAQGPSGYATAAALRNQAAAYRAQQQQAASSGGGGGGIGPSSQDVANIIQGAGAAAAGILKAFQEGRVAVAQAKTASGITLAPPQAPVFVPQPAPAPAVPGWAWGVGAAALGLLVVFAAKR